jgi:hypothetical protein
MRLELITIDLRTACGLTGCVWHNPRWLQITEGSLKTANKSSVQIVLELF